MNVIPIATISTVVAVCLFERTLGTLVEWVLGGLCWRWFGLWCLWLGGLEVVGEGLVPLVLFDVSSY